MTLALIVQAVPGWIFYFLGNDSSQEPGRTRETIQDAAAFIGDLIPKSISYSEFFLQNGNPALAVMLLRLYGFCTGLLMLNAALYLAQFLFLKHARSNVKTSQVISPEQRPRLQYIERLVIAAGILVAYFHLIGLGLRSSGSFPTETISGGNVLLMPILCPALLLVAIVYISESRRFLRSKISL
jgi:hypothetical protein